MTRRRIRSLEHYEARATKRPARDAESLEPRVVKPSAVNLYTYGQLCALAKTDKRFAKAKSRAYDWFVEGDFSHLDYVTDLWKSILADIGFCDIEINWNGFSSQGDGASFTGSLDAEKLLEFMLAPPINEAVIAPSARTGTEEDFWPYLRNKLDLKSSWTGRKFEKLMPLLGNWLDETKVERDTGSRYYHENTCTVKLSLNGSPERHKKLMAVFDDFRGEVEWLRCRISVQIYRELREEYDHQQSDEYLIDLGDANDYYFTEGGRRYDI